MGNIIVTNAHTNNLKNVNIEIEFNKLTICVGPSGSGKSSFAFDTLIKKEKCEIKNYPKSVQSVSQRLSNTSEKLDAVLKLLDKKDSLIIIDEPLAGTTHKEALEFSEIIKKLAINNAVVVVEHRKEIFEYADIILEFGPKSGPEGGNLLRTMSGKEYLKTLPEVEIKKEKNISNKKISAYYDEFNGIENYEVELTLNSITAITGPSKSGKSTYLMAVFRALDKSVGAGERRKGLVKIKNKNYIRRPHIIDVTIQIREQVEEIYKDNNLITRRLIHLKDIGLDYLKLNQSSYSLSGGECQRIKLAKLLCKKLGDRSVYIFDNPVRGLGTTNISQVMLMFDKLVKNNNTILIAENDTTALKFVDNIIELK